MPGRVPGGLRDGTPNGDYWSDVFRRILDAGKLLQIVGQPDGENEPENVLASCRNQWGRTFRTFGASWEDRERIYELLKRNDVTIDSEQKG